MSVSATSYTFSPSTADALRFSAAGARERRPRFDDATEQVRDSLSRQASALEPGSIVTARYQYRVGPDGALLPIETRITTESADSALTNRDLEGDARPDRRALRQQRDERPQSFADIARPRPQLSPAEEVVLFAVASREEVARPRAPLGASAPASPAQGEAVAEDGSAVDVEILTANTLIGNASDARAAIAAQAQTTVATLYARNNDIVYNAGSSTRLAA